jgi:hypothetical protein
MLTPVNYVDLFDRLYPEQHLHGLTDDNQITVEELNRRYATIRANQRTMSMAMNAIYADQPEGAHLRDFMLPFWEVAYSRKYVLSTKDIASLRYIKGYDPAGLNLEFPESRIALYANDCGSELLDREVEFLLFSDGLLVAPSDYAVHPSQGGFAVYLKESRVVVGAAIRVVVFRKFNQRGKSFERIPAPAMAIADPALPDGTAAAHVAFSLTALGYVHDLRYYALFAKKAGDQYFRPVPADSWSARAMPGYDTAIVGLLGGYAEPGAYEFALVDKAEFWKFEVEATVAPRDSVWKIDLVDSRGMPVPVADTGDVDVWSKGRKLRAGVDYWVEFGSPDFPDIPPRIMFEDVHYGDLHLLAMSGAPRDSEACVEMDADVLPNADPVVRFDPRLRKLRLLQNVGLVFSSGYLELAGDGIETVADNLALHFNGLRDADEFNYRARFVFAPEMLGAAFRQTEIPTVLERFARTVGSLRPDGYYDEAWYSGDFREEQDNELFTSGEMDFREGAYRLKRGVTDFREGQQCKGHTPCDTAQWDLVAIHRRNHPSAPLRGGVLPNRNRGQFPAAYFYLRDEYRDVNPIVVGGDISPMAAWKQGPKVNLDFRQKDHGPDEDIEFDFRGEIPDVIPAFPGYTTSIFTSALAGQSDFRDGAAVATPALKRWERDTAGNIVLDGRELISWMSPQYDVYDVYDFRGENPDIPDTFVSYVSGTFTSALAGQSDFRDGAAVATPALKRWERDTAGNIVLDGRELISWMSPQYDVYDFRGEKPDTFVSYVSGAFTSALGPAPDFRDGRGLAPAGWSMDAVGNTVFDARELFHWRATADDVVDFRGQTVPLTEVAVKPTAAFVDALAPTVDARSTDVPASLGAYAVNSVGDIVVDGRDLIYFGSTTSVPLEGRETASP